MARNATLPARISAAVSLTLLLAITGPNAVLAQLCHIEGMVTAAVTDDPGFEGLWKYSITFQWDTEKALSHANVFLALKDCACVCEPGIIQFPDPAAESMGELPGGEACTAQYVGDYVCMGDPTIPEAMDSPAVKYDALTGLDGCEPGTSGVGYAIFYTPLPPAPVSNYPDAIGVKAAKNTCLGDVVGQLPMCDCIVQNQLQTWGEVKGTYR